MDVFDAIANRRSIRRFKPDPIPDADLEAILNAARLAPSGTNAQPWAFVVVRSPERKDLLREAGYGQPMLAQAPAVILLCGNRKSYKKRLRRGKELVEIGAVDAEVMETVAKVYGTRSEDRSAADGAITANAMIAGEHLCLAATAKGLGACWVMLFDTGKVAEAAELPEAWFPIALIPVGYPDESPAARPRYALSEVAFDETADTPWEDGE